jgi:Tfp pilus assembly protein PilN
VRAVNLIPADAKGGGRGRPSGIAPKGPAVVLVGLLGVALVFVTIYVLTSNTINDRQAKLANLKNQVAAAQAQAARLSNYASFVKLAESRAATVRQIASSRFDWHAALADLSKVVPANTSLQSLLGTVAPGATVSGAGGSVGGSAASTGSLRSDLPGPAFELKGCTHTQDDVARLMSRLRLIDGVTRVTLADSLKQDGAQGGASVASTPAASAPGAGASDSGGCGANTPSFDLVVFFQPLPGASTGLSGAAGPVGSTAPTAPAASSPSGQSSPPSSGGTSTTPTTPSSSAATPQQQVSTTAATSTVPVTNGAPAGGTK